MVNLHIPEQIGKNKLKVEKVDGKILKFYVKCRAPMPHATLKAVTHLGEVVAEAVLSNETNFIYPFVCPTNPLETPEWKDYFWHYGDIYFYIENATKDDFIENFIVYTE